MHKSKIIFFIIPTYLYALYNPFFQEIPQTQNNIIKKEDQKKPTKPIKIIKEIQKRKNIEMTFFGFIQSMKGTYALVSFNGKNIIIQEKDSLYLDEQIYKVRKISSNYILVSDREGRAQTVYFSSDEKRFDIR